ncbi:protection of telomeres protein 1 isoform X2 [Austrofundulus limnaeus]|uniref:Protection of telomeres protein 1 n=1 Tax=Austrofundulus limnaeus TaxID=52670 RepID=A0A2I4CJV9_AUSLI|nr:PREDICTED: protection of telomeres protein 1 isoform X2 [Austrofundulus limnaeus]
MERTSTRDQRLDQCLSAAYRAVYWQGFGYIIYDGQFNNMPVEVQSDGTGTGAHVPAHLTQIPIAVINIGIDCTNKIVKGKVIHKGPLVTVKPGKLVQKAVIQDDDDPSQTMSINIILLGSLAKDFSEVVNQGDVVTASGFTVGKSPTAKQDKLHPFDLILSGDDAFIYVSQRSDPDPKSSLANRRRPTLPAEDSKATKASKYTYVKLDNLKDGSTVNVYGVVVFFRQPYQSRGTDFCSSLKITDQSNHSVACTIFCENLEDHPKIFKIGDIIRMHRVKVKSYNNSVTLVSTFGFSVVTFDGSVGGALEPRTSSKSFSFTEEDRQTVEELRSWAAGHVLGPSVLSAVPLSDVQLTGYFDLTCQLLAKATIQNNCTLLRVWDGTKCPHTLLEVIVEPGCTEGPTSFSKAKESLIANVLVYDNHAEFAKQLKPGDFLRIYNLRAIPGSIKVSGLTSSKPVEGDHVTLNLHGGTSYGKGIRVLPEDNPDVQKLKRVFESLPKDEEDDLSDSNLIEIWGTPPESLGVTVGGKEECSGVRTERSCSHQMLPVTLAQLKQSHPDGSHHVRVQLRSFEPRRLYQALKLFCNKCSSLQDIPDDELVAGIFSEASQRSRACRPPDLLSGQVNLHEESSVSQSRVLGIHLCPNLIVKDLMFLEGSTLEETRLIAAEYQNIVPVTSSGDHLALLDLSAPFLFRDRRRYYGCKQCSETVLRNLSSVSMEVMDEKMIANTLGVELLQFVFVMKLELQDATDTLDVFLMKHALHTLS